MNIFILVVSYVISVFTGSHDAAGTDANIFLTIYGEKEDSGKE
jgi:hypothetical protein